MNQSTASLTPQGAWKVRRHVTLPTLEGEADVAAVAQCLESLPGVRGVQADPRRHRLTVVYDITRLNYRQILDTLTEGGYTPSDSRWARLKTNWLQGLDETGRENAHAPAAPCCSKPPQGAGRK
jgi:copper chaperone CopZ